MATTSIHAIKQTVASAIKYVIKNKTESVGKDDISDSIKYAMNDKTGEITYHTMTSTLNCVNVENPVEDFHEVMKTFGRRELEHGNLKTKDGAPVLAWHLIQSFEGKVNPRTANEIGRKMAEELFKDFPAVISTHTNTENTHNHIVICAWNLDGEKWNQSNKNYQRIRECSDKLCDEYGLSVIESNRQQKLVRWTDENGNTRYYEPSERKNELIKKRQDGEISTDDVNSYRNTLPYEISEAKKETNAEIVKRAIDSQLPYATSYEHLLQMMRELGFKVKDKKKNGDWLAHISFTPPTADKGVRDYKIGDGTTYTRENLTAIIEEQVAEKRRGEVTKSEQPKTEIPHYEEYEYGEIDVQSINEDYRADITDDGRTKIVQRGEVEKDIIHDVKKNDRQLYETYDTTTLRRLITEQKEAQKRRIPPKQKEEVLVRRIQESFANLKFIEEKKIYSYSQINQTVKGLWTQYNLCLSKMNEAEQMVNRLEYASRTPALLAQVKRRVEEGKNNPEYVMEKFPEDEKLIKSYISIMKKYKITDSESLGELKASVENYRERISKLQTSLDAFSEELAGYNRCISVLSRIDRENYRDNTEAIAEYNAITKSGEEKAKETSESGKENKKKNRGYDR